MSRLIDSVVEVPRRRVFSTLEWHAVAIGSIGAVVLLAGWGFGLAVFQSFVPGFPAMEPASAVAIMLLSVACLTSLRGSRGGDQISVALAIGVCALAGALLFLPQGEKAPPWAGRPAYATLLGLFTCGTCTALATLRPKFSTLIGVIALIGATPALFRVVALVLYGLGAVERVRLDNSMSLPSGILIVWYTAACIFMHPKLDFGRAVFQPGLRGRVLRRALPAMILTPVVLAIIATIVARGSDWPAGVLFGGMATLTVSLGVVLIWWIAAMAQQWQIEANEHAGRLSRANEALERFASAAAHDLKAPARHILLYVELLEDAEKRGDEAGARKFVASIREAAAELPRVIEGMLEYSRSAWTRLSLGQHQLSELVGAAAQLHEDTIRAERAHIAVTHDATVLCDPILLTAVFQNLISNSLKSGKEGQPVHIKVDAARQTEADGKAVWSIVFEDNGKGFPREHASTVFNPLVRGVQARGQATGIGLATCRTIVESHRGDIRVDPDFRDGARIIFTLAADPPPAEEAAKPAPAPAPAFGRAHAA